MQITCTLRDMSDHEREQLAAFILTYGKDESETVHHITGDTAVKVVAPLTVPATAPVAAVVGTSENAHIDPAQAFSTHTATNTPTPHAAASVPQPPAQTVAPQTASPASGVDVDARGFPWNERIHSNPPSKTDKGVWRKKRGVDDALVTQIEAELRGVPVAAGNVTPVQQAAPVTNTATSGAVSSADPATAFQPQAQQAAPIPQAVPQPPASSVAAAPAAPDMQTLFVGVMGRVSAAIQANKLTMDELTANLQPYGMTALPQAAMRPDVLPLLAAQLDALIASKG